LCSVKVFEDNPFAYKPRVHTPVTLSKNKLTNFTTVYNETKLFLKKVCVVAYGIIEDYTLFGAIAVRNVAFEKSVNVRLTFDEWETSKDITAKFAQQECDGHVDRFFFVVTLDEHDFDEMSSKIEFAVCYTVGSVEHWDNNDGSNFKFIK